MTTQGQKKNKGSLVGGIEKFRVSSLKDKEKQSSLTIDSLKNGVIQDFVLERQIIEGAKKLAQKLNKEIEKGNDKTAFMIALMIAAFKDFLDVILTSLAIGLIPGVNFFIGLFLTSFLFFFMLRKGWFLKFRIKFWFWFLGLFIDGLPGFSVLPINILLVLYAWKITKKRSAKSELKLKNLNKLTNQEIEALNKDISLLESSSNKLAA